ncbi:hypothetical protein L3556_01890 [Candidatus Synechococcus calcipolaris G9]|uniref:Polyketide cyclase n=1 Tax=Candidatus Synechococcus calcipolaris G9 TaxID=1497997 RepID=A0ABT6EXR4_9SYNE|nr:hypothetical protein [Candidatus Synechococcus calcipolaris]MDG2989690.1 hypothetical protein [Candidatus Synechococcus calcipolaris G9]
MLGQFQRSQIRIEIPASASQLRDCLTRPEEIQAWLWPQQLSHPLPDRLETGLVFQSKLGPLTIDHQVKSISGDRLVLILGQGIDGWQEWLWGENWIQSSLEGVSLLPLELGQTLALMRLRHYLSHSTS